MKNTLMPKVFAWMFLGLLVTFITGIAVFYSPKMIDTIYNTGWLIGILIAELVLVIIFSARIGKMSPTTARIVFLLYSFVNGLTFSSIFITYDLKSILYVFLIAATIFGLFALYGGITKRDLTRFGPILFMALIGVFLCIIVNIFLGNAEFDLAINIITILIFIGFTAYDIQKIKVISDRMMVPEENLAVYGALQLYLDYINIFLRLLTLFGKERD